jgi:hypothetical protein
MLTVDNTNEARSAATSAAKFPEVCSGAPIRRIPAHRIRFRFVHVACEVGRSIVVCSMRDAQERGRRYDRHAAMTGKLRCGMPPYTLLTVDRVRDAAGSDARLLHQFHKYYAADLLRRRSRTWVAACCRERAADDAVAELATTAEQCTHVCVCGRGCMHFTLHVRASRRTSTVHPQISGVSECLCRFCVFRYHS